jgi:hypothetical protein
MPASQPASRSTSTHHAVQVLRYGGSRGTSTVLRQMALYELVQLWYMYSYMLH